MIDLEEFLKIRDCFSYNFLGCVMIELFEILCGIKVMIDIFMNKIH
jgi:hypothetical protein